MIISKYLGIVAVVAAIGAAGLGPKSARAAEDVPAAGASEAGPTVPRSPLRLSTVDYVDTNDGSGKLTVAGIALPGKELYLFLDDEPLAKAVPDDGGKWSIESEMKLGDGRHTIRADQYDAASDMLAARAMVSIERAKPGSGEAPAGSSPPKATTP
jgi:hypothetical protein